MIANGDFIRDRAIEIECGFPHSFQSALFYPSLSTGAEGGPPKNETPTTDPVAHPHK